MAARRNLNLYFEEERNLISVNTILGINYQFVDFTDIDNNKSATATASTKKENWKVLNQKLDFVVFVVINQII